MHSFSFHDRGNIELLSVGCLNENQNKTDTNSKVYLPIEFCAWFWTSVSVLFVRMHVRRDNARATAY